MLKIILMIDTDDYMLYITPIEHIPLHYNIYGENGNIIFIINVRVYVMNFCS